MQRYPMTMGRNNERKMVFFIVVQFQKQNLARYFCELSAEVNNDLMFLRSFLFFFFFFFSGFFLPFQHPSPFYPSTAMGLCTIYSFFIPIFLSLFCLLFFSSFIFRTPYFSMFLYLIQQHTNITVIDIYHI